MAMTPMSSVEPFLDSTSLLSDPTALRRRADELGYLFFPGLLATGPLLDVRQQILQICQSHSWIQEGTDLSAGIAIKEDVVIESTGDPRWQAFYNDVQKLRDFHALCLSEPILGALEVLFGESVLPHPRNILRVIFPRSASHTTPPHQDHFYIGGSRDTWTAWFPLGDCDAELGSLAVVPGSHQLGFLDVHEAKGAGGRAVAVDDGKTWVGGDFACGDLLFVHSLAIHQGRPNETDRLRLSCDFRYQPRSHQVRRDSLTPHMNWLTWDEIYQDWPSQDPVRSYWCDWDLNVVERT
ncbi:MAG: phytanoyl-CoA dioxygenase [Gemmatimonadetes bacterium]|nr:phytanoyl-CoA dioxygenase [Gemmatimonadota bacterium]MBT6149541.1 phytanoyl-CoA dioxygenase [Gemmatimonadota bacterium]MBT7864199.1 phytanoyl-CoA dioxygenase [Gemmatimonadota bacterium]